MKLILASNSAARRHMLTNAGYQYQAVSANIDEREIETNHLTSGQPAFDLAPVLANAKAKAVSARYPADLVIGSDQVLLCQGNVFTKVKDLKEAAKQLSTLQGKTHQLISAVACWSGNQPLFQAKQQADMSMYRLTAEDIEAYLADTGSTILGSVGCYQIEGKGIRLFENIDGSHFAIMGMPLIPLLRFLRQQNDLQ